MKKKLVGVVTAVVLAAVGTLVLVAYVNSAEDRALAGERTVDVLVVTRAIDRGTPAEDIAAAVETEQVPAKVRADGAVTDVEDLGRRVAAVGLRPGEQVITSRFVDPSDLESVGQVAVPDGLLQVTVALAPERAVGGLIEPGSTVGVLASFEPFQLSNEEPVELEGHRIKADGQSPNSTHLIARKALVTAVQSGEPSSADDDPNQAPSGNLLVTLALDAPGVEEVVFTAEHGSLWLAYEPGDAPEGDTQIVTRAVIYR